MITVFDTNAYLNLVSQKSFDEVRDFVERIKEAEASKGYHAYIHPVVSQELMYHLLDIQPENPTYTYTKACVALYNHCSNKETDQYFMAPYTELQRAHAYWNIENTVSIETEKALADILYDIENEPTDATVMSHRDALEKNKRFIDSAEQGYVHAIEDLKNDVLSKHPECKSWREYLSVKKNKDELTAHLNSVDFKRTLAVAAINAIVLELQMFGMRVPTIQQMEDAIDYYLEDAAASIELQCRIYRHLDNPDYQFDQPQRINMIWDSRILSILGHRIAEEEILLVTSDNEMRTAATVMPHGHIMSYNDYLTTLGIC